MTRKNPDNKPLRIVRTGRGQFYDGDYAKMLVEMMKSQALLVRAGKDSAMPHFLAIIKELERMHEFKFEQID